jgi:hypothetical protein
MRTEVQKRAARIISSLMCFSDTSSRQEGTLTMHTFLESHRQTKSGLASTLLSGIFILGLALAPPPPAWGPVVAEAALEPGPEQAVAARVQALGAAERAQAVAGAAGQFILWTNPV